MGWFTRVDKAMNREKVRRHLADLSRAFPLWLGDDDELVIVSGVRLPPGYGVPFARLLIELPPDYPLSPPGVGAYRVFVPADLRFRGKKLRDLHEDRSPAFDTPGFGPWAWWCYERIEWDPFRDDLIRFVEMVRADMTDPPTDY